jgi:hypothetical protein
MTERGLPSVEGSPACPFVAFEDDRDERADRPDHRHRCYAEAVPAPRALAHQEAYCLSSAFPVCPTFQDWARRESARARAGGSDTEAAAPAGASVAAASAADEAPASEGEAVEPLQDRRRPAPAGGDPADEWQGPERRVAMPDPIEATPRRNPPRDWAAPPPWATGAATGAAASEVTAPDFLERRSGEGVGLAGSPADRIASGQVGGPAAPATPSDRASAVDADPELAGLVGGAAAAGAVGAAAGGAVPPAAPSSAEAYPPPTRTGKRPAVSSTRAIDPARDRERERERQAAAERANDGPSWERSRRYEAYPTIRRGTSMPNLPRVGVLAVALLVAAVALFFLPQLLDIGGSGGTATPSPSVAPSATAEPSPTPVPEPTQQTYVIKQGDTLSKIARRFGISLEDLLAANKDTIKDPNKIGIGDEIIIPAPAPDTVTDGESAAPSDAP